LKLDDYISVPTPESESGVRQVYRLEDKYEDDRDRRDVREEDVTKFKAESARRNDFNDGRNDDQSSRPGRSANGKYRRSRPIVFKSIPSKHPLHDREIPVSRFNTETMRAWPSLTRTKRFSDPRIAPTPYVRRSNTHSAEGAELSDRKDAMQETPVRQRTNTFPKGTS
jgi:hypothetical protein